MIKPQLPVHVKDITQTLTFSNNVSSWRGIIPLNMVLSLVESKVSLPHGWIKRLCLPVKGTVNSHVWSWNRANSETLFFSGVVDYFPKHHILQNCKGDGGRCTRTTALAFLSPLHCGTVH
ncbi:hypothetical protein AALO_G00222120 [Alosa alosa]|uniref:Uncharacterized protein n=1 Tax=Alosa alosa TaxID=278164 RepID=A0AAV6FX81_9TELE|nr:hypothetical protein AALO_G00222120 [Alosa alosa]